MPVARELADLPYAHLLQPHSGELHRHGVHDAVHFDDQEFEDTDASDSRFDECAFTTVTVTGGHYRGAKFNDVWTRHTRWMGTDLSDTVWSDTEVLANVLAGVAAYGARLTGVVFRECKFNSVNLRETKLRNVTFQDCVLREVDFSGAELKSVTFPATTLDGVRLARSTLSKVDLREAADLGITDGYDALGGAVISSEQLLTLAPALAQTLGITVRDR